MKLGDSGEAFFVQETAQLNVREKSKRHSYVFFFVATGSKYIVNGLLQLS